LLQEIAARCLVTEPTNDSLKSAKGFKSTGNATTIPEDAAATIGASQPSQQAPNTILATYAMRE
jgi:hypothetical protein